MPWLISAVLAAVFLALYLSGLAAVPFHPDESSWLVMSGDFAALVLRRDPGALVWQPGQPQSAAVQYRLLNAPLPKYLIGLAWWLGGYAEADLNADWIWPQTWDENVAAGHLPPPGLLLAGRVPAAVLSALSTVLIFWIGYEAGGLGVGLAAALLLGLNPLVLLHGRRAMAEGPALFFSLLAVWGCVRLVKALSPAESVKPAARLALAFGVGVLIGLAVSSKQTAAALLPSALLAMVLPVLRSHGPLAQRLVRLAALGLAACLACGLTFWALNPILYRQPLGVAQAMLAARAELAREQTEMNAALQPAVVTPTVMARLRAALLEIYLRPPAVWDLPVYVDKLAPQAEAYLAQPLNRLARTPLVGALVAGLGAAGAAFSALRLIRSRLGQATLAEQTVWWWSLGALGLVLLTVPFDWQRYFVPLAPPACLFAALGARALVQPLAQRLKARA